ncbi:MAG TPA: hypothetical protein VFV71_04660 [Burkholderiales bacterium]|nr:hypothetical protein [Burkholderiales bacterium]
MSPAARATAAALLLAIATLPVLSRQFLGRTGAEIPIFMHGVDALLQGRLYGEHAFEYPPYALIWFLAPYAWSSADVATFRFAFGLEVWLFDAAIKAVLLRRAIRGQRGFPDLIPFFVYSLGSAALGHLLLMKYDAIPAALSLAGVLAVTGGWPGLGGATMMLAAGTKAYPALFIPILAVVAWRRSPAELRRYAAGVVAAAAPLLLLALWMPWWTFASFHGVRGLEVGSLAASLVWALHLAGVGASWALIGTSNEVSGPLAGFLFWPARLLWVVSTLGCLGMAVAAAVRTARETVSTPPSIAALMLLAVAAFVATNTVFSPQFHLWLVPLAALALEGRRVNLPRLAVRGAWVILLATMIVPTFYPSREYALGLGLWRTSVLVLRNLLLLYATVCLWNAAREMSEQRHGLGAGLAKLPV